LSLIVADIVQHKSSGDLLDWDAPRPDDYALFLTHGCVDTLQNSILQSLNVTSITDTAVGNKRVFFINSYDLTNYYSSLNAGSNDTLPDKSAITAIGWRPAQSVVILTSEADIPDNWQMRQADFDYVEFCVGMGELLA